MTTNLQLRSLVNIPFLAGKAAPGDGGTCLVYFGSPAWISYTFVFFKAMSGGDALILGQEYSRDLYFNVVERHRPQILFFWPEVIVDFVALPEQTQARLAGIAQVLIYGGARTPASALLHLCQALPATQIHQGYGASECFRVASLTPADHAAAAGGGEAARRRLRSAGRPLGAVRVVDDDGQPVPRGVAGWIQVQPDPTSTFQGYYRNPAATAKKFSGDGWVILGDLGRLDEDGYLYIDGRDSETIVLLSGDNVYPNEVEGAIAELPGVLEVGVAKVVSEEGAISEVGAFIRVCEGSELSVEDIKAQCHKRLGQAWCHPTHIFFQTEKLPRNRNGKCIKAKLTERAAELLQHRLHAQGGA